MVMNSLLHFENLGGQVQMVYVDPPYGIKFGSNFQPFVRKREVKHGGDEDNSGEDAFHVRWLLGWGSPVSTSAARQPVGKCARQPIAPALRIWK